ncbi:Y-family DNA polymerase [Parafannyhessea umbonata]|uniref:DNA polymerase V n=1 Tax=Parafannyhessea umbonata TaxID=604330 RepID=A0A1H9P0F6_9ACTN|nr:DNA repair protein [Parafannyhessea umbonata]SER41668.1 DNA polymerase V [Parafannyhessea umbonata]
MGSARQYLVIDLKSFYASVECVERGLDPMTTDLVVADASRTSKTICLAVSPSLKAKGVRNRCRLFEIPSGLDYIVAPPRMVRYIEVSADIYEVYLKYVSPDDIHVYSIDEAFLDVTGYLTLYGCSARELGERIRADVVATTGIPATCGLGTNLYLAKVALDITAKHSPDFFGILDEQSYRETLWSHTPITDFWRVGPGTARRLAGLGIHTMGQLAVHPQDPIYHLFGVDAEILIDHAWGREPVTIADIKAYRSRSKSLTNGQVLGCGKDYAGGLLVTKEMTDELALQLVEQRLVAGSLSLSVGYRLSAEERQALMEQSLPGRAGEHGVRSRWGQFMQGGTVRFDVPTNSRATMLRGVCRLYGQVALRDRTVARLTVTANDARPEGRGQQLGLFDDAEGLARERRRQEAISAVKHKFGKNALLKGMDLLPEATQVERNGQIGGHRSGV